MAVKFKEIHNKLTLSELTPLELKYIDEAEEYIDSEIHRQYGKYGYSVNINMSYPIFKYSPKTQKTITDIFEIRRHLLISELRKRYNNAGWSVDYNLDTEGGMNSCDYWVLSKIKKL